MAIKPLKQLLDEANGFIQNSSTSIDAFNKVASGDAEVLDLANLLAGASTSVSFDSDPSELTQLEFDKLAESFNRVQAANEIEEFKKLDRFEKKAQSEGYAQNQISEVFSKIAASKLAKALPVLATLGLTGPFGKDENELAPKKLAPQKPTASKSLGN